MGSRRRAAVGLIGAGAAAISVLAAPAIAALPNAVIGTGKVGSPQTTIALVNSQRRTVYMFTGDHNNKSSCNGACLTGWKPVLTGRKVFARAGSGVSQKLLGTTRRSNGQLQVTYNRHPLYTNNSDNGPGQDYGQACPGNTGGHWFIVNKRGNPNKTAFNVCGVY